LASPRDGFSSWMDKMLPKRVARFNRIGEKKSLDVIAARAVRPRARLERFNRRGCRTVNANGTRPIWMIDREYHSRQLQARNGGPPSNNRRTGRTIAAIRVVASPPQQLDGLKVFKRKRDTLGRPGRGEKLSTITMSKWSASGAPKPVAFCRGLWIDAKKRDVSRQRLAEARPTTHPQFRQKSIVRAGRVRKRGQASVRVTRILFTYEGDDEIAGRGREVLGFIGEAGARSSQRRPAITVLGRACAETSRSWLVGETEWPSRYLLRGKRS